MLLVAQTPFTSIWKSTAKPGQVVGLQQFRKESEASDKSKTDRNNGVWVFPISASFYISRVVSGDEIIVTVVR